MKEELYVRGKFDINNKDNFTKCPVCKKERINSEVYINGTNGKIGKDKIRVMDYKCSQEHKWIITQCSNNKEFVSIYKK